MGNGIELRKSFSNAEAEFVRVDEGNMSIVAMQDDAAPPWSKAVSRKQSSYRNLGGLATGRMKWTQLSRQKFERFKVVRSPFFFL